MWIPQENKEGYEAGNAMNFVKNLKGRLMLYYGTADNNVHPTNAMQLIQALQKEGDAGKGTARQQPLGAYFYKVSPGNLHLYPCFFILPAGGSCGRYPWCARYGSPGRA